MVYFYFLYSFLNSLILFGLDLRVKRVRPPILCQSSFTVITDILSCNRLLQAMRKTACFMQRSNCPCPNSFPVHRAASKEKPSYCYEKYKCILMAITCVAINRYITRVFSLAVQVGFYSNAEECWISPCSILNGVNNLFFSSAKSFSELLNFEEGFHCGGGDSRRVQVYHRFVLLLQYFIVMLYK